MELITIKERREIGNLIILYIYIYIYFDELIRRIRISFTVVGTNE